MDDDADEGTTEAGECGGPGLLRAVDSVQLPVPDLDVALRFYRDGLGQELVWRTATAAAVRLPGSEAELVLQVERPEPEVDLLVASVDDAVRAVVRAGGSVVAGPFDLTVGRAARVADPFGTVLTLVDLTRGRYATAPDGTVTGLDRAAAHPARPPADEA